MKPIETSYLGYRFRSRLEARWAVVFETLGIRWQYEADGWEANGARYLPDFWLPLVDAFVEVKGADPTGEDIRKIEALAVAKGKRIFVAGDIPPASQFYRGWNECAMILVYRDVHNGEAFAGWDDGYRLCRCDDCGAWGIEYQGRSERIRCRCEKSGAREETATRHEILRAYSIARAARFEHGEKPGAEAEPLDGLAMLRSHIKRLTDETA